MTHEDIKKLPVYMNASLKEADEDRATHLYLNLCYNEMLEGRYGVGEADTIQNDEELESGYGRLLCRYPKYEKLNNDIYIIAQFNKNRLDDIEFSRVHIMYVGEY